MSSLRTECVLLKSQVEYVWNKGHVMGEKLAWFSEYQFRMGPVIGEMILHAIIVLDFK